jgi:hypothetical protein
MLGRNAPPPPKKNSVNNDTCLVNSYLLLNVSLQHLNKKAAEIYYSCVLKL